MRMKNRIRLSAVSTIVFLLLALSCVSVFADVPDVSDSFYVADYADVLDADTEDYIVNQNAYLEENCEGAQIVVMTTDFLDGLDIEDYAKKVFDKWEIGASDENNGVLLLLAIGEENYWCMQGKGLESSLTAGDIDEILYDYLEDDFAAEDYSSGVQKAFEQLADAICEIYGVSGQDSVQGYSADGVDSSYSYDYDSRDYEGGNGGIVSSITSFIGKLLIYGLAIVILIVVILVFVLIAGIRSRRPRGFYGRGGNFPGYPMAGRRGPAPRPPMPPGGAPGPRPGSGQPFGMPSGGSRPARRSGGLFGGSSGRSSGGIGRGGGGVSRGGGAGRRSSGGFSSGSRSSFGSSHRSSSGGIGRGGGGISRGGGAGRRGK